MRRAALALGVLLALSLAAPAVAAILPPRVAAAGVTQARWDAVVVEVDRLAAERNRALAQRGGMARDLQASHRALMSIAEGVAVRSGDRDLGQVVQAVRDLNAKLAALEAELVGYRSLSSGAETQALFVQASDRLAAGDIPGASEVLAKARAQTLAALRQANAQRNAFARDAARAAALSARALYLGFDLKGASARFLEAADLTPTGDPALRAGYLREAARVETEIGRRFAEPTNLETAIRLLSGPEIEGLRAGDPLPWAGSQVDLGQALLVLGRRGDDARLALAVGAFRRALAAAPRSADPAGWAAAQLGLGDALEALGERGDDKALADSIAAYDAALSATDRSAAAGDWADVQISRALALSELAQRGDRTAFAKTIAAVNAALVAAPREVEPDRWATAQVVLGNTFMALDGADVPGALPQAIDSYRKALTVRTRERDPANWAITQMTLGVAFMRQGARGDTAALKQAIAAHEAALTVRTRERNPYGWAMSQMNLANVYLLVGQTGDVAALRKAVALDEAAVSVWTRTSNPRGWAVTTLNRGRALEALDVQGEAGALAEAVEAYRAAGDLLSEATDAALRREARDLLATAQARLAAKRP